MAFNYMPAQMQTPQINYMQQPQQSNSLGGLSQFIGAVKSFKDQQAQTPEQAPSEVGFGLGQDLVAEGEGGTQYAKEADPASSSFMDALTSIIMGGGSLQGIASKSGAPGLGAIGSLAGANPLLSSLMKGGVEGALGKTIGAKIGGLF